MPEDLRIGHGFDVHRFATGRKLILAGVEIPHGKGLVGHSDADVLLHAVMNALLGAMSEGDIGVHFPDSDPAYKGIPSTELLRRVLMLLRRRRFRVLSLDVTLVAERPKLAPFYGRMKKNLAAQMKLDAGRISVKAATAEGLGAIGAAKGIAATAVVLLGKRRSTR